MKATFKNIAALLCAGILAVVLVACGGSGASTDSGSAAAPAAGDKVIKVGASPSPHAEILAQVSDALAEEGYTLEVVEFTDYIQPNVALYEGELDANYFQHTPYLDDYNAENGTDLESAVVVHFEPMSAYSSKHASISEVPDGAKIAVPSDPTNEARALLLLEAEGVFTLKEGVGLAATAKDIEDNPHKVELVEVEAAQVPQTLADVDFAVANGNYALDSGITTQEGVTVVASEGTDSEAAQTYGNIIAVRNGETGSEKTQALIKALTSDAVRDFINSSYDGVVVATF